MANTMLDHFTHLKQAAVDDYLSPLYGISNKLNALAELEVAHG